MDFFKPDKAFAIGLILLTTEWVMFALLALAVIVFFNSILYQYFPGDILQLRLAFSGFLFACILAFSISSYVNFSIASSILRNREWTKFNKMILFIGIIAILVIVGNDIRNYMREVFVLSLTKVTLMIELLLQVGILVWVIKKQSRRVF